MAQPGYFDTTIGANGTPITIPTLTYLMGQWETWTLNQSVLSLDNQGETGPAAVGAMCLQVGQGYIKNFYSLFNPAPPDAVIATVTTYQSRIVFAAGFVNPQQWVTTTFSNNIPGTIAQAVAAAQAAAAQPVTPPSPANFIGPSYSYGGYIMFTLAVGVSPALFQDGNTYTNSDGTKYVAHVTNFVVGTQVWFTTAPVVSAGPAVG